MEFERQREKGVLMKHIPVKRIFAAVILSCCLSVTTLYAETSQEDINNAKEQITDLEQQKNEAENNLDAIEDKKAGFESDLNGLNAQLSDIVNDINEIEVRMSEKENEIETAEAELKAAEQRSLQQYEDMKIRIQFMYENGNTTAWQMLFESTSFTDFLNRSEYISEINEYDRDMLARFLELQQQIAEQKESLEEDMAELVALGESMKQKQASVNTLIANTRSEIEKSRQEIEAAQSSVEELEDQIAAMIAYERELEIQKAKEDAARLEAIRAQEQEDTSGVVYVPQDSDAYLLGAIIQCEADGEGYDGKLAVGSVVLNRVKSSYFPNTISGVIYQGGQFSPVASGRLAYRLEAGVNSTCLQAAQEVLNGNITLNCLYFRTNNGIIDGIIIGNHVFY